MLKFAETLVPNLLAETLILAEIHQNTHSKPDYTSWLKFTETLVPNLLTETLIPSL